MPSRKHLVLVILIALVPLTQVAGEKAEPAKVLVMGVPSNIRVVALWLEGDPMTDPRMVPARIHLTTLQGSDIQRFIRLYFPRTYEQLLDFEYIMLIMVEVFHLTQEQQLMIYDAIYKDGRGALQDRSVMSMAAFIAHEWADSIISDAFPNDADKVVSGKFAFENIGLRYVINKNPNIPPILSPYKDFEGVETYLVPGTTCITIPKEGAVVTSYSIGRYPSGYPGMYPDPGFKSPGWVPHTMYWRYGNGTTWTHQDMLGGDRYWIPSSNPFSLDMLMAEFMFATGRDLPDDVVLVHRLRGKFASFASTKGFIYSLLDFIDKFGANGGPVVSKMQGVSEEADQGKGLYLGQDYEQSMILMDTAIRGMEALRSEAMRLKDRALFWVYVVEWFAVTGVSLLAGFLLWTLMVRRRLYREVRVTRLLATE